MKFCKNCGASLDENASFCSVCGQKVEEETTSAHDDTVKQKLENLNNTKDESAGIEKDDIEKNKIYAVLSYLGILVLVPILAAKNSKFAMFHANQGLLVLIVSVVWNILSTVTNIIGVLSMGVMGIITGIISFAVNACIFALVVVGIVNAVNGKAKELPVIGKYRILK